MDEAACRDKDPQLFFPEKNERKKGNEAILTCFNCPVRSECKDYRKRTGSEYGIWAGEYTKRKSASTEETQ